MRVRFYIAMLCNDARVTSGDYSAQVRRQIGNLFRNRHRKG